MSYTIKEFMLAWKKIFLTEFELITDAMIVSFPFLAGISKDTFRTYMVQKYGSNELLFYYNSSVVESENLVEIGAEIKAYIINELAVNEYKYKTLFATMMFEYVPLNNATLKEIVTVTNDLEDVTGGKVDTLTETVVTDDKSTTNTLTIKNSSFDDEELRNVSQTIEQFEDDPDTDVTTTQNVLGQQTDKHTGTVTTVSERAGSIGVITNQDMIEKERKIANFSFYHMIIFDFVRAITYSC